MAFKSVKYHFTLWSKANYEKISRIHPWITWYIRPGHGILCLGSFNLIRYITHIQSIAIQVLYKHFRGGGLRPWLLCLFRGGVQNSGKPAYIILARSPIEGLVVVEIIKLEPLHATTTNNPHLVVQDTKLTNTPMPAFLTRSNNSQYCWVPQLWYCGVYTYNTQVIDLSWLVLATPWTILLPSYWCLSWSLAHLWVWYL